MRRLLIAALVLVTALLAGAGWLLGSESGLRAALHLAARLSDGRLQAAGASGRLLGPLQIDRLHWQDADRQVTANGLQLDWSPAALAGGQLHVGRLAADAVTVLGSDHSQPTPAPDALLLPLAVAVDAFSIGRLQVDLAPTIHHLAGRLSSDGRVHVLADLRAGSGEVTMRGEARLDGAAPPRLTAAASLRGQLAERPLALALQADGPLTAIHVAVRGEQGILGRGEGVLTPFAAAPFARLQIALAEFDPAAWNAAAPAARLAIDVELAPREQEVGGRFTVRNAQPGALDRARLPLAGISGQLAWSAGSARLSALRLDLHGGGLAEGSGRWQNRRLQLDLALQRIDARQLHSALLGSRLAGHLSATLGRTEQNLSLDLRDARFVLSAEASHAEGQLSLPRLALAAGDARLSLSGSLDLGGARRFAAEGEFQRFDPSRFGRLPAAQINGHFAGSGHLQPQPVVDARFRLSASRLAGQPLAGEGRLLVDWPRVPQADIDLQAGANHLQVRGAFGRPGDVLDLRIDAPTLAAYGIDGDLEGQLALRGTVGQPVASGNLQARRFVVPGLGGVRRLALRADAGRGADEALNIDLQIGEVDLGERRQAARDIAFRAAGSNRRHDWQLAGALADGSRLTLSASGALEAAAAGLSWRGRLLAGELAGSVPARNLRLTAPADLLLGRTAWALGPLQLAGSALDWRATLQAGADGRRLQASMSASGTRIGRLTGELAGSMRDAWQLDRQGPWQGRLSADIADLGWLGELIGEGWQTGGRFSARLDLAGTPARPTSSGQLRGEQLALRQPAQGLLLSDGELAGDLQGDRLRIQRLAFASLLQPLPRTLRQTAGEELAALTRQPGRLEASGEMAIGTGGSEQAALDFRLERVGIVQLPEQWVALSGGGRLTRDGGGFGASAQLTVDAGYWQLAPGGIPRLSDDVVVRRSDNVAPPPLRPALALDVSADLGRHFHFSGAGLNSRLSGDIRLQASGRDLPRATGSIRLRDGRFDAYGQRLAIKRGILSFQGLLDNPALDVLAVRQGLPVEPGVQIGGTARRPVIRLVSDPELPDAEKLAWLVLGHGPETVGAGDATLLVAAAGGLLGNESGGLVQQLKNTFGIDEFAVRQGELGGGGRQPGSRVAGGSANMNSGTASQILSVGKRLSSNALLSYEQAIGRAEGIVKLTVSLNRQLSVIGRAGSDNALDLFYTLAFGRNTPTPRDQAAGD